jgi:hypothetical protein
MEGEEFIAMYPATYSVEFSDRAFNGGVDLLEPDVPGDPLSVGTAWLYHLFQNGTLDDYNYTGTEDQRKYSARLLQDTIWWLEDEEDDPGSENIFRNMVISQFDNAHADNNGQYPVSVLNVYNYNDSQGYPFRQDLLVCNPTPVPEPATMLLVGSGLIALGGLARRKFKK